jgi:para-aminobenzoate synthetase component 1
MSIPSWAQQMDQWAAEGIPFLFILDFELKAPMIIALRDIESDHASGIRFQINKVKSVTQSNNQDIRFSKIPVSFEEYQRGFDQVLKAIKAGDTYLLNLCYSAQSCQACPHLRRYLQCRQCTLQTLCALGSL